MVSVISISAVRDGPVMKTDALLSFTNFIASDNDGRMLDDFKTAMWISGKSDACNAPSASSTDPVSASPQMAFVTPTRILSSGLAVNSMFASRKRDSFKVFGSRWILLIPRALRNSMID